MRRSTPRAGDAKSKPPSFAKEEVEEFDKAEQDPDYIMAMQQAKKHAGLILFQL